MKTRAFVAFGFVFAAVMSCASGGSAPPAQEPVADTGWPPPPAQPAVQQATQPDGRPAAPEATPVKESSWTAAPGMGGGTLIGLSEDRALILTFQTAKERSDDGPRGSLLSRYFDGSTWQEAKVFAEIDSGTDSKFVFDVGATGLLGVAYGYSCAVVFDPELGDWRDKFCGKVGQRSADNAGGKVYAFNKTIAVGDQGEVLAGWDAFVPAAKGQAGNGMTRPLLRGAIAWQALRGKGQAWAEGLIEDRTIGTQMPYTVREVVELTASVANGHAAFFDIRLDYHVPWRGHYSGVLDPSVHTASFDDWKWESKAVVPFDQLLQHGLNNAADGSMLSHTSANGNTTLMWPASGYMDRKTKEVIEPGKAPWTALGPKPWRLERMPLDEPGDGEIEYTAYLTERSGQLTVMWMDSAMLRTTRLDAASGHWSAVESMKPPAASRFLMNRRGDALLVWGDRAGINAMFMARESTRWSEPTVLFASVPDERNKYTMREWVGLSDIALDEGGGLHVFWTHRVGSSSTSESRYTNIHARDVRARFGL